MTYPFLFYIIKRVTKCGYSIEEAGELAATTAKLLNVSEFTSVEDATSALVSSLQAFTTEGEDVGQRAEEIVDILNNIGNRYPVATNELADGLATSSAALVAANNSIEEQVALLSAGNATMQDISSVASGLKIVAARLRGTTTDIDDDADSAITNTSKLQSKIKALTAEANGGEGINIINEQGEYKSTYEILREISEIFDKMDDVSSASLLELIAGKNRSSVVAAILQNGDILENAYIDAFDSEGSSQKELETYLDSIQGRIDLFDNSVQTMWMNFINTDVAKFIVNVGTGLVKLIDNIGLIETALMGIVAYVTFFKKQSLSDWIFGGKFSSGGNKKIQLLEGNELSEEIEKFNEVLSQKSPEAFAKYKLSAKEAGNGMNILADKVEAGAIKTKDGKVTTEDYVVALQHQTDAAQKAAKAEQTKKLAMNLTAMAIAGIISAIKSYVNSIKTLEDRYEELQSNISTIESGISSLDSELKSIEEQIDELSNKNLTISEAEELKNLKEQSEELQRQKELRENILSVYDRQNEITSLEMFNQKIRETAAWQEKAKESAKTWAKWIGAIADIALIAGGVAVTGLSGGLATAAGAAMIGAGMGGAGSAATELAADAWGGKSKSVGEDLTAWYESYIDAIATADQEAQEAESKYLSNISDVNYDAWQKKLDASNTLKEDLYNNLAEMQEYIDNLEYNDSTKSTIDGYNDLLTHIDIQFNDNNIESQISSIESLKSEFYELSNGVDENGKNVALSAEEYARYCDIVGQILAYAPGLIQSYDSEGNAILGTADAQLAYNQLIAESIELLKEQRRQAAEDAVSDESLSEVVESVQGNYKSAIKGINPGNAPTIRAEIIDDSGSHYRDYDSMNSIQKVTGVKQGLFESAGKYIINNIETIKENWGAIISDMQSELTSQGFDQDYIDNFVSEYSSWLSGVIAQIDSATEQANAQIREKLYLVPQSSEYYNDLSGSQVAFINSYILGLEDLKDKSSKEIQGIRDDLLTLTQNIGNNENAQKLIDDLFALDPSKMPIQKYKDSINEIFEELINDNVVTQEQKETLCGQLFSDLDDIDLMQEKVGTKLTESSNGLVKNLTLPELKIAYKYLLEEADGSLSFEEMKQKIAEYNDEIDGPIVDTYSALQQQVADYNDVVLQTVEIVTDNTLVTQEYKDALVELGVSEEELAECFDDTNNLVVTNAKKLQELVKTSKKNTAQNIKLAKSQARLQYYELFKKMQSYVTAEGNIVAGKQDEIVALNQEMNALEKTIAKYSMLEVQLLNTTNAYETFQQAQEADAATDYIGEVEEAVLALGQAFNTAELGTETAQAAIAFAVPKSVYEDLDTVDEKMSAIYDYFKNGKLSQYLSLEFDDDGAITSAEMKLDNLRKFIEGGLANGSFTGDDWQHFELSEDIYSFEQLAEQMEVTKDVLFAIIKSVNDHDIEWLNGDYSTLFDRFEPTQSNIDHLGQQMQEKFDQTPIDLTARVKVSKEDMVNAGYTDFDGDYATLYTHTFNASEFGLTDAEGNDYAINVTPILPDGTVIEGGYDGLVEYINGKISSGESLSNLDIFLGSYSTIEEAVAAAEELHNMQEAYYSALDNHSFEYDIYNAMDGIAELNVQLSEGKIDAEEYVKQYKLLNEELNNAKQASRVNMFGEDGVNDKTPAEIDEMSIDAVDNYFDANQKVLNATTELEAATSSYQEAVEALSKAKEEGREATEEEIQAEEDARKAVDDATETLEKAIKKKQEFAEPTEAEIKIALDDIESEIAAAGNKFDQALSESFDLDENGYYTIKAGLNMSDLESKYPGITKYVNLLNSRTQLIATADTTDAETSLATINDTLTNIQKILETTFHVKVEADGAITTTNTFKDLWDSIKSKTVSLWTKVFGSNGDGEVNGTANIHGTAHASGNWGLPTDEHKSLVGELGPELVVDPQSGRYYTVGDRGAEFVDLKRGSIIFNHKQTESLLQNGYVASRGKAYAEGNAHVTIFPNGASKDQYSSNSSSSSASTADDVQDEFEELFDWIEVRLEEINADLDLRSAQLENKVGYQAQNKTIDQMIDLNEKLYDNLLAGANKYYSHAQTLLAKIPAEYRQAAQDGTIAIETFTGEVGEETLEAIEEYREWVQKGDDAVQQAEETLTEISQLAKQAIDNIATDFENKNSIRDNKIDQLEAYNGLSETKYGSKSASIYEATITETKKKISTLEAQRDKMQAELNQQVEAGNIKKYSQEWYDAVNDIAAVDTEIIELTKDTYDYQDAINELHWDNFDNLMSRLDAISDEADNLIDILGSKDLVNEETGEWTDEGITSLGLYAQQMDAAEVQAEKYKKEIDYLNKNWESLGYTEQEYVEKLDELKDGQYDAIKAYQDSKDAIVDLTKARVDAIKKGIEREIETYEELIDKKKEELDAEKDLYDFQKSVTEQQKDISDIERKLAALSADNSASARAQRAKLEAELAKAQAELQDMYYERSISDQQDALDKEFENFQTEKEQEIEGWDDYLENANQVVADGLASVQANTDIVYQTLREMGKEYSLDMADALISPWKEGENAIQSFSEKFGIAMSATVNELDNLAQEYEATTAKIESSGDKVVDQVDKNAETYTQGQIPKEEEYDGGQDKAKEIKVGGKINAGSAKIYDYAGDKSGKQQYYSDDPVYKVLAIDGDWVQVRYHKLKTGVTGWFRKSQIQAYAKGTTGTKEDQLALIDELGDELIMHADGNGKLAFLSKGSAVIPHDISENLMQLGELDPQDILDRNRPVIGTPNITNNNIELNVSFGEVVHIDHVDNDAVPNLAKTVEKQIDKYMKNLNAEIRKYTR